MARFRVAFVAVALSFAASAEPAIDRPLALPHGTVQGQVGWEMLGLRAGGVDAQHGVWFAAGGGLAANVEIDAAAVFSEADGDFGFDRAAARGVFAFHRNAAIRLDTSIYRFRFNAPTEYGYASGLGVPFRIAIVPGLLSIIGGRTFAMPPIGRTIDEYHFADDVFTLDLNDSNVTATIGFPLGIQVQPADPLSVVLRSGYRHGWGGGGYDENWVPVGIDVLVDVASFELVASAELPGNLNTFTDFFVIGAALQARF